MLAGILGLLGFAGCETEGSKTEYGTPHADYTVKGKVVDKVTKNPIEGIQVKVAYGEEDKSPSFGPATTDANGDFLMMTEEDYLSGNMVLFVDDIDGEQNGLYNSEELTVNLDDAVQTGKGDGWYKGEYTITKDVELTEAGSEPQE